MVLFDVVSVRERPIESPAMAQLHAALDPLHSRAMQGDAVLEVGRNADIPPGVKAAGAAAAGPKYQRTATF